MVLAADSYKHMKNSIILNISTFIFLYNENCSDNDDEINFLENIIYLKSCFCCWLVQVFNDLMNKSSTF